MIKRETWIELIKDFQEFQLPQSLRRDIKIETDIPIKRIISIIGARRTGKTFSMFQVMKNLLDKKTEKERILYINFESDLLIGCDILDLTNMVKILYEIYPQNKKKKIYLFFDEIQNVPNWEKFVRRIMDSEKIQIFISGSSSKLLSKEIATALRGRTLSYQIYPFSFKEFLKAKNFEIEKNLSSSKKSKLLNLLEKYLKGSYPEVIFFEEQREKILREILDVTIYRDIVERYGIKNTKLLRLLLKSLVFSLYFSPHKFYNYLKSLGMKVSKNTIYKYLEYFLDSFVVYTLKKYSKSYKEIEQTSPKIYFIDNGLMTLSGFEAKGRSMENLVFIELLRRDFTLNNSLFYFSFNNKEVDFVIKKGKKIKQLIQVCYAIDDYNTKEREVKSLIKASKILKCNNLLIITWNYEGEETIQKKKIKFIPLWKWLLE